MTKKFVNCRDVLEFEFESECCQNQTVFFANPKSDGFSETLCQIRIFDFPVGKPFFHHLSHCASKTISQAKVNKQALNSYLNGVNTELDRNF